MLVFIKAFTNSFFGTERSRPLQFLSQRRSALVKLKVALPQN